MNEKTYLDKVSNKTLDILSVSMDLHNSCKELISSPSQENIDQIASLASKYQEISEEFQNSIMDLLKSIVEPSEEIKITSSETDIGYKIN